MSGCYEGWTLEWRDWVLVGTGPAGQQASLGEVWTDNTGAHYELLDPIGGDRFHTAKAPNRPTAQRIATNLARRVGANFKPSDASQASEPVSHTGSVARPTDVAAQPEAGASGGEASPGASAPQAGPPSAREPETVGADPAPVTGSSHAPLPAGDAPSPAVGTPGMHRQGVVSGVDPDPAASACYGRPPLEEQVSQLVAELEAVENERDALAAQLAPQPAPVGGKGDCWAELLAHVGPSHPAAAMGAERRAFGLQKYNGQPVRRGDGRDSARDLREELLDAAVYAWRLGHTVLAVHLLDLAAEPGRGEQVIAAHHAARAERDALRARLAELDPHGLFDIATAAQSRIAELEESVQELATARADLAIVDQILTPICGPTIPDDRRVRLGVLLARAPRWT